jgi:uncharacterized membrane protein
MIDLFQFIFPSIIATFVGVCIASVWFMVNRIANFTWKTAAARRNNVKFGYLLYVLMQIEIICAAFLVLGINLVSLEFKIFDRYGILFSCCGAGAMIFYGVTKKWMRPMAATLKDFLETDPKVVTRN